MPGLISRLHQSQLALRQAKGDKHRLWLVLIINNNVTTSNKKNGLDLHAADGRSIVFSAPSAMRIPAATTAPRHPLATIATPVASAADTPHRRRPGPDQWQQHLAGSIAVEGHHAK